MGLIRTLLALSVVVAHAYRESLVGGRNAVQLFYIISGFLISYVLVEKRAYSSARSFYTNRLLRLYPVYAVVAILTLLFFGLLGPVLHQPVPIAAVYQTAPTAATALLAFANVTLLFQDWIMFLGVQHGTLLPVADFNLSAIPLWQGLVVPQAWTIGVELSFYLLAPFVLPRRRLLVTLLCGSLGVRVLLLALGIGTRDPWTYRFFPAELALFLLGALAHQIGLPFWKRLIARVGPWPVSVATYAFVGAILCYWPVPLPEPQKSLLLIATFVAVVPVTLLFQAGRKWDKFIGDLSYPLYIGHMLALWAVERSATMLGVYHRRPVALAGILLSLGFAAVLNELVAKRFERVRAQFRRVSPAAPTRDPQPATPAGARQD